MERELKKRPKKTKFSGPGRAIIDRSHYYFHVVIPRNSTFLIIEDGADPYVIPIFGAGAPYKSEPSPKYFPKVYLHSIRITCDMAPLVSGAAYSVPFRLVIFCVKNKRWPVVTKQQTGWTVINAVPHSTNINSRSFYHGQYVVKRSPSYTHQFTILYDALFSVDRSSNFVNFVTKHIRFPRPIILVDSPIDTPGVQAFYPLYCLILPHPITPAADVNQLFDQLTFHTEYSECREVKLPPQKI